MAARFVSVFTEEDLRHTQRPRRQTPGGKARVSARVLTVKLSVCVCVCNSTRGASAADRVAFHPHSPGIETGAGVEDGPPLCFLRMKLVRN